MDELKKNFKTWRKVKLGEFMNVNPSVQLQRGKKYPFLDMAEIQPFSRTTSWPKNKIFSGLGARFKNGDTLFARITPCLENGKIAQALNLDNPGFGSTEFYVLRGKEDISDSDFVYYLSRMYRIRKLAEQSMIGASGRQRVERAAFENIEVEVPSNIADQKRIASILSAFDDKIELNNKISKNLEQTAQAVFKEWFIKFKVKNEKFKVKNDIPEGWKIGTFKDLLRVKHGFAFPSDKFKTKGIPVIKIKNILKNNKINLKEVDFIELNDFKNLENFKLKSGDVLIAMTGATSGKIGILVGDYLDYFLNQRVGKFEFLKPENKWFSFIYLTQSNIRSMLLGLSDGSAQGNLSPSQIENLEIIIPESKILQKFNNITNDWFLKVQEVENENQKLAALRNLLLPKLMSGEVRV